MSALKSPQSRRLSRPLVRRATALAVAAGSVLAVSGTAVAHDRHPHGGTAHQAPYRVDTAQLATGLYQSAYSGRHHVLWATTAVGRPPVTQSRLLKVDPKSLKVKAAYTPPVTDQATGAVEAVYGVAVDDEHDTVWTTNTRNNSVAVYSQRTGKHLATLPSVAHAREIVVDKRHDLAWASGFGDGSVVAFDTRTFKEKKRVKVEGAGTAGLAVDTHTGTAYATDLTNDRIIAVSPYKTEPRFIPTGDAPIGIDLSADGRTAYTANQAAGTLSVVDLRKGTVTRTVTTGAGAISVAADHRSGRVFVANRGSGTTTVVDPKKGTVLADLATGPNPNHVTVRRGTAYVVDKSAAGADRVDSMHRISLTRSR
ncbi:YncE family protein [Streptomyces rimosus]|uniref:YncE family protein n=1 Tax=Streptomyces rimosus TaxID=1927 RepID=UPI0004C71B92|nr:YncE family protein [Streptomyces rimosus]